MDIEKLKERAIESLEATIKAIDDDKLTDGDKVDFFDTYKEKIIEMLKQQIEKVKKDEV
mgnify:CR=1 FL=1